MSAPITTPTIEKTLEQMGVLAAADPSGIVKVTPEAAFLIVEAFRAAQAKIAEQAAEIERLNADAAVAHEQYLQRVREEIQYAANMREDRNNAFQRESAAQAQHRRDQERVAKLEEALHLIAMRDRASDFEPNSKDGPYATIARAALQPKKGESDA